MTEEEARTKWCPMARVTAGNGHVSFNRDDASMPGYLKQAKSANCIASDCMMWVEDTSTNISTGASRICGGHCGLAK